MTTEKAAKLSDYLGDSLQHDVVLVADVEMYNPVIRKLGTGEYELTCDQRRNGSHWALELPRRYKTIPAAKAFATRLWGPCEWKAPEVSSDN